jgi:hypothetical protein
MSKEILNARLLSAVGGIDKFQRNWSWRSFSPEQRAQTALSDATDSIHQGANVLIELGATIEQVEKWTAKAIRMWLDYQAAGARTANPMITGPANFPTRRNEKANAAERKRGDEYYQYVNGASYWLSRRTRSAERAALSEQAATVEHRTLSFEGVKLVQNTTLDRIQLLFDGKPEPDAIALLKRSAFRWSPRESAWQRQNTNNGIRAAYGVLKALGHESGKLTSEGAATLPYSAEVL